MTYPFIPAVHTSAGSNLPITRIVIHGTVSPTSAGTARSVAKYFQSPGSGGSAQYVLDTAEIVRCVPDNVVAWHAPPNPHSIGVEFCDWVTWSQGNGKTVADIDPFWHGKTQAQFDNRWALPDWDKMLRLGATLIRALLLEHKLPPTRLSVADLLAGRQGICGHADISAAWHQTDHTDPGSSFPWSKFIGYVVAGTTTSTSQEIDMTPEQATILGNTGWGVQQMRTAEAMHFTALSVQVSALTAAVAALAQHPDITPEQITTIIGDAIAAQVKVTGTLTVTPAKP